MTVKSVLTAIHICIKERFGDKTIQTEINDKPNVVTFRNKAKAVLYDFYSHYALDPEKKTK